jgi:hypothetical protein
MQPFEVRGGDEPQSIYTGNDLPVTVAQPGVDPLDMILSDALDVPRASGLAAPHHDDNSS